MFHLTSIWLLFCVNIVNLLTMMFHTGLFHAYVDATCASVEKKFNELTDKKIENTKVRIAEYSECFNQSRENYGELDSSFGSPKPELSLYDDFDPFYVARPNLKEDMPLPSLEPQSDIPTSLSQDLAPHTSLPKDATDDILISFDPPALFYYSCEFEVGEQFDAVGELDMSVKTDEHHEIEESEEAIL